MFDAIAGAGNDRTPTAGEIRLSMTELLHAVLPGPARGSWRS
jgi:hypothetical protein